MSHSNQSIAIDGIPAENTVLKDAAGLGVVILMIAATQLWSFVLA